MDRKMAAAGDILAGMNLHNRSETSGWSKSLDAELSRQKALEELIIRLYASARKEIPSDEALEIEVRLAMDDLKEIPDRELGEAFREAQIQSGGFVPTNGLIVKVWRGNGELNFEEAQRAIRMANSAKYLLTDDRANLPTPEEREANAKAAAEIARKLAGAE